VNQEVVYEQRRMNWYMVKAFVKHGPKDRCFWCKDQIEEEGITKDHVIPASRRGQYYIDYNKVNSCLKCNRKKGNLFPTEWLGIIQAKLKRQLPANIREWYEKVESTLTQLIINIKANGDSTEANRSPGSGEEASGGEKGGDNGRNVEHGLQRGDSQET